MRRQIDRPDYFIKVENYIVAKYGGDIFGAVFCGQDGNGGAML